MKKIMCLILFVSVVTSAYTQGLHVASGGTVYVSPKSYVYVGGNLDVSNADSFTVVSDATDSASLLINSTASGDVTYERHIPTTKWHFVSAPVTDQSINDFATNVANDVKQNTGNTFYGISFYDNGNDPLKRWRYYTTGGAFNPATTSQSAGPAASATNFVSGRGYSNLRASVGTYTFKGALATGDVTIAIAENNATAANHHFGVVGNPYPAFLAANSNANASNVLTQNISKLKENMEALYFWDGSTTSYEAVNNSDNALYLAPGQAFAVEAKADGETFTFSKALTVPQPSSPAKFYKTEPMGEVTVFLTKDETVKKTRLRYLTANATLGFDRGYDAGSYRDGEPSFSVDTHLVSNSEGVDFTLQCLPKGQLETTVVPLAVYANANEEIRFSADAENLPNGVFVFLEDKQTNTITKISDAPYSLTPTQDINGIGRFYLHTAASVLSVDEITDFENVSIYKTNNSNLRIVGLENTTNTTQVKLFSLLGKEVVSATITPKRVNDVALPKLSAGVYLVQVVGSNGKFDKKIFIE
jgi:hypothetical protein